KVEKLATALEKVVAVENYIKTNFTAREDIDGDDAENLERIIKTKLASELGIVRLYAAIFRKLGIEHEFVLATSRDDNTIEKNFENWNNCDNSVIYFPTLKKYMAPTEAEYRFPWIDPMWGNANAFYCRSTTIGNYTTAFGEVKNLPLEDYSKSASNTDATVELNKTADTLLVNISQIYSGYAASVYKAIFTFSSDEYKKEITKEMIKFGTKSENVVSSKMENQDFESYHQNKPFILSATVKASELVERAGNKTIVKIGDIIGPQAEMYEEKPRQFPITVDFPHVLERNITFIIPDGYIVKNPDDLKINVTYTDGGQVTMGFVSDYKIEGNKLKIHIMEEYRRTYYPLAQYEIFKKIINAAADFNKVVLVLEKK
ncbi:MAG: transglutaminase domain-containing protein, partial [Chitinophagaceae bacterium]|nr:transglutaminase domain-containing protein [Chitinophagaceae bacterium]